MPTYEEIGKAAALNQPTLARFVSYMRQRWADREALQCGTGYATEWAERFKAGQEWRASDQAGQRILDTMTKGA